MTPIDSATARTPSPQDIHSQAGRSSTINTQRQSSGAETLHQAERNTSGHTKRHDFARILGTEYGQVVVMVDTIDGHACLTYTADPAGRGLVSHTERIGRGADAYQAARARLAEISPSEAERIVAGPMADVEFD